MSFVKILQSSDLDVINLLEGEGICAWLHVEFLSTLSYWVGVLCLLPRPVRARGEFVNEVLCIKLVRYNYRILFVNFLLEDPKLDKS